MLRDSLGGNCNTLLIGNIWGEREHIEETISTLRFATRMMCVTVYPEVNIHYDPLALIKKYEREIKDLKQELSMYDTLSNRSHVNYEPYTEVQRQELTKAVKKYLENDEDIEIINLRQIKESFSILRALYKQLETSIDEHRPLSKPEYHENEGERFELAKKQPLLEGDKLDGVGDMEGAGFGVGLAPFAGSRRRVPTIRKLSLQASINVIKQQTTIPLKSADSPMDEESGEQAIDASTIIDQTINNISMPKRPGGPMSREEEFENFKRSKGAEMSRIMTENKSAILLIIVLLKTKKKQAKDLAEMINHLKSQMDEYKEQLQNKKKDRPENGKI